MRGGRGRQGGDRPEAQRARQPMARGMHTSPRVNLPALARGPPMEPLPSPEKVVLIVEDRPDTRKSLAMLLTASGFPAAEAADGQQALDYLRSHPPPGLILLDLAMPVMDGWEF